MLVRDLQATNIANPKLTPCGSQLWYDYYAGYSASFAKDAIAALLSDSNGTNRVLDPWNGSGTTTIAASVKGHRAIGIDRNPALVVIAKGRHLPASVRASLAPLANDITQVAARLLEKPFSAKLPDELSTWFVADARAQLRALERAVHQVLVDGSVSDSPVRPGRLSTLAAFFYCALFTVVRQLTAPFRGSNPTWIRRPTDNSQLLSTNWDAMATRFLDACATLADRLLLEHETPESIADLRVGAAERLTVARKVDLTLGSPPYCTRIDYVIATYPELAVLGYRSDQIQRLRRTMLGSPLTRNDGLGDDPRWGRTARRFLKTVEEHPSKASSTYYLRYYTGYLRGLHDALLRLDHLTRRDGTIALVVQDSYYKEAHFDLPAIVTEIGRSLGRSPERLDFDVPRTMASLHPGARAYRSSFRAVESLVVLRGREADRRRLTG
jgi:hypothetical protein